MGWTEKVYTTSSMKFNEYFWTTLKPNISVSRASSLATSLVSVGYYTPIGTIGDANYNGYANN